MDDQLSRQAERPLAPATQGNRSGLSASLRYAIIAGLGILLGVAVFFSLRYLGF